MKTCTKCTKRLGIDKFGRDKSKKDGYASHCKNCRNVLEKSQRAKGKRNYGKKRVRCPLKRREYVIRCRYGLELDEVNDMLISQDNKCAICKKELIKPHIDHEHVTGKVRGLLCCGCNTSLGVFDDSIEILKRAIDYLESSR